MLGLRGQADALPAINTTGRADDTPIPRTCADSVPTSLCYPDKEDDEKEGCPQGL